MDLLFSYLWKNKITCSRKFIEHSLLILCLFEYEKICGACMRACYEEEAWYINKLIRVNKSLPLLHTFAFLQKVSNYLPPSYFPLSYEAIGDLFQTVSLPQGLF